MQKGELFYPCAHFRGKIYYIDSINMKGGAVGIGSKNNR